MSWRKLNHSSHIRPRALTWHTRYRFFFHLISAQIESNFNLRLTNESPRLFWAAAPKSRYSVGHRGEFPYVLMSVLTSIHTSPLWSYSIFKFPLNNMGKWQNANFPLNNTVGPRNNSPAFKGSPSIKVNISRSQMIVFNVILPHFKGKPEIKVKNLRSQWDRWGGVLLYGKFTKK